MTDPMNLNGINLRHPIHALMYLGERLTKSAQVVKEGYYQQLWSCGTAHCAGGWAVEWKLRRLDWTPAHQMPECDGRQGWSAMYRAFALTEEETTRIFGANGRTHIRTPEQTRQIIRQTLINRPQAMYARFVRDYDALAAMG